MSAAGKDNCVNSLCATKVMMILCKEKPFETKKCLGFTYFPFC